MTDMSTLNRSQNQCFWLRVSMDILHGTQRAWLRMSLDIWLRVSLDIPKRTLGEPKGTHVSITSQFIGLASYGVARDVTYHP